MIENVDDAWLMLRLQTMRIVLLALIMGIVSMMVIFVMMRSDLNAPQRPNQPILSYYVACPFTAVLLLVQIFLPKQIAQVAIRRIAATKPQTEEKPVTQRLVDVYQSQMIISSALLEGPAFLNCIAYFMEGSLLNLGLAGGLASLILLKFPTQFRIMRWMEEQLDYIHQRRAETGHGA
jgi:NADH:ubiquinone oxidoreductase subunit 6 (subunit J)